MATDPIPTPAAGEEESDPRLARDRKFVQQVLRGGLALALVLMVIGFAVHAAHGGDGLPAVPLFAMNEAPDVGTLLMALGVLALALTPAFRVVSLVALWAREKDYKFMAVAIAVMVTLGTAVALGHG